MVIDAGNHQPACSRTIMANFARRAYRRTPTQKEIANLVRIVDEDRKAGDSFEEAIAVGLQAVLVSPSSYFV